MQTLRTAARTLATVALLGAMSGAGRADTLRSLTSVQFVGHVSTAAQLIAAKAIGVRNVRLAVRWYEVEKVKGALAWGGSDARILPVVRAGMTPIITIFGGNAAYPVSSDAVGKSPPTDGDALEGYAKFAAATAKRYGTSQNGAPVLYEIWNEPNTKTFWSLPPDPEGYARMAGAACRAMKAQDPSAKVLALGMEGTPVKAPYYVRAYGLDIYQQWAGRAATPELMECVDGISFHPYRSKPETYLDDEPALKTFMSQRWRKTEPPLIANTEWGHAINLSKGGNAEMQAKLDVRALLLGAGLHRTTSIYQVADGGRDPEKPDQTYGLADFDGKLKPAGVALQRLMGTIGDFDIDGVGPVSGEAGAFRFSAHKGSATAAVLWSVSGGSSINLAKQNLGADAKTVNLVSGEALPIQDGAINVDDTPVLVVTGSP